MVIHFITLFKDTYNSLLKFTSGKLKVISEISGVNFCKMSKVIPYNSKLAKE